MRPQAAKQGGGFSRRDKLLVGLVGVLSAAIFALLGLVGYGFVRQTYEPEFHYFRKTALSDAGQAPPSLKEKGAAAGKIVVITLPSGWQIDSLEEKNGRLEVRAHSAGSRRLDSYNNRGVLEKTWILHAAKP